MTSILSAAIGMLIVGGLLLAIIEWLIRRSLDRQQEQSPDGTRLALTPGPDEPPVGRGADLAPHHHRDADRSLAPMVAD